MTAEIKTQRQYCNMMYVTVSHVIEIITSTWLGYFLHARIWEPLSIEALMDGLSPGPVMGYIVDG
jgi:LytS/YehU family sensor histidine kinase